MRADALDPAPRNYPPAVSLYRRAQKGSAAAPATTTVAETRAWLLTDALGEDDLLALFEALVWRLVATGLPLDRASLHVGTLHPQLFGFAWNWQRDDGICDEVRVAEDALKSDAYKRNPIFRVIEYGEAFRGRTRDPETASRYPLMSELAGQGISEYVAIPLRAGGAYHNAATVATKLEDGFTSRQSAALTSVLKLFSLHVERHISLRITANVLDTYLGSAVGERVLHGTIRRGAGEPIRAVIWSSDLRGFTELADRLSELDMIAVLNAYFERLAGAVMLHGGEVMKFIGDGLLAVFPYANFPDQGAAVEAAIDAAFNARDSLAHLCEAPPAALTGIRNWKPLKTGIALHDGEVFLGNIGAPGRLDFTVIGRAVNVASRVEALSKVVGRDILITGALAPWTRRPLEDCGTHRLRGVEEEMSIYSPMR